MIASDCIDERKPRLRNSDVFALPYLTDDSNNASIALYPRTS
ncbi:hypothetical protein ACU2Q1_004610 [Salmonella enterica subsp. enterica serovar Senftenberg]